MKNRVVLLLLCLAAVVPSVSSLETIVPGLDQILRPAALFDGEQRGHLTFDVYSNYAFAPWEETFGSGVNWAKPAETVVGDVRFSLPVVSLYNTLNTGFDYGPNDRSYWQGRGVNTFLTAAGGLKWGALELTVAPEFWFSQNAYYRIRDAETGDDTYGNYWKSIDAPQRFGDDPVARIHPGQSGLRLALPYFTLGLSTENIRLGPGVRNNIILSNNAPGFPHIDLGTFRPLETGIGTLEARLFWGRLKESEYFDDNSKNDHRLITGGAFAYSPSFVPQLTVGLNRVIVSPGETVDAYKIFQLFEAFLKDNRRSYADAPSGDDDTDQVISVFAEWLLRDAGFRAYIEYARNDHAGDFEDLYMNPEHTRAYTAGVEQRIPSAWAGHFLVQGEVTVMNRTPTAAVRPAGPWYRHGPVEQGYTHRGQYLGTYFGSGGNSQYLGIKYLGSQGLLGWYLERTVYDNDFFYSLPDRDYYDFYVETATAIEGYLSVGAFDLYGTLGGVFAKNRWWVKGFDPGSFRAEIGIAWRM